jgi:AcrR family transcriptional regulator
MPYPAQINRDALVARAREMIEAEGVEQLSLHKLAAALGVKAPSLYRYFASKTDLLRDVNLQTARQMTAAMKAAADIPGDARARTMAMAKACREFGYAYPMTYRLAFTNANPELRPDDAVLEALAIPIQQVMAQISGEEHSLAALRGAWALIHGFIMFELSGQFRRGGDLEAAFFQSMEAYLEGWSRKRER